MSWIAEYDTRGREFPTCVHVTKTTGTMTHGVTYVPIEDGEAVRTENEKLRGLVRDMWLDMHKQLTPPWSGEYGQRMCELEIEVDELASTSR